MCAFYVSLEIRAKTGRIKLLQKSRHTAETYDTLTPADNGIVIPKIMVLFTLATNLDRILSDVKVSSMWFYKREAAKIKSPPRKNVLLKTPLKWLSTF